MIVGVAIGGTVALGALVGGGYYVANRGSSSGGAGVAAASATPKQPRKLEVGHPQPDEYISGDLIQQSANVDLSPNGSVNNVNAGAAAATGAAVAVAARPSPDEESKDAASYDGKRCVGNSCCRVLVSFLWQCTW